MNFIKELLTSNTFLTVISGVLVFLFGQLFNEYFLKPIQKYKNLRAQIAYALTYYAMYYSNPLKNDDINEEYNNASIELRKLAAKVDAMIELRPKGNMFIPKKDRLSEVSKCLIGLSNGMYSPDPIMSSDNNQNERKTISEKLKLKSRNINK